MTVERSEFDLVVIGSGAGGLSCAVTGAALGLDVMVLEKESVWGGTTAWSGGWLWIPRNPLAVEAGIVEDIEAPRTYLRHELGENFDAARIDAFLAQGPRMVEFFRSRTSLEFIDGNAIPDFHGHTPGAREGGRSVCAAPFHATSLGPHLATLRPPLDLLTLWGMGIASGAELKHFLNAMRSWRSFAYVTRRVLSHWMDLALHRHAMRLVNGNALAARLGKSAFDLGVALSLATRAQQLVMRAGRVVGVIVESDGQEREIVARRGVVLACGGFPHDHERMRNAFPHTPTGAEHWSAAPFSNTGDGLRLGESVGGHVTYDLLGAAGWAPVSLVPRRDGSVVHYPHLIERAKPGVIAVTREGKRFVNEAGSYYDFMRGLFDATPPGTAVEAWLVCDHRFIRRYGLGAAKPAPMPLQRWIRSNYLKCASTVDLLARECGIDAKALRETIATTNSHAQEGRDPAFRRGETPYERAGGDAAQQPNPCVGPIEHAPFYAVRVVPGSLGTFAGLITDASSRVLDSHRQPIEGLYVCGADMASLMGGRYPSGGITLGPAMAFGFIAAHHAAGVALDQSTAISAPMDGARALAAATR